MTAGPTEAQIDAALLRLDADVQQRLRIFDGGPELMSWANAHRLHRDEPYIGCPFCQDQFVSRQGLERALRRFQDEFVREYGMGVTSDFVVSRIEPILAALSLGLPGDERLRERQRFSESGGA